MSAMPIEEIVEFLPVKQQECRQGGSVRSLRPDRVKVRSTVRPDVPCTYVETSLRVVPDLSHGFSPVCHTDRMSHTDRIKGARAILQPMYSREEYSAQHGVERNAFSRKRSVKRIAQKRITEISKSARIEELHSSMSSRALRSTHHRISTKSSVSMPSMSAGNSVAEPLFSHAMKMVLMGGVVVGLMCLMFSFGLSTAFHTGLM